MGESIIQYAKISEGDLALRHHDAGKVNTLYSFITS